MTGHRVTRTSRDVPAPLESLPRDAWVGETFVEADGTACDVVWNGHRDSPSLCGAAWNQPHCACRVIGKRHTPAS